MLAADYARVERAIHFLGERVREQPSLAEVAAAVGLSEFHFQRLFQRWAGISPKRFLQVLTLGEAKRLLSESQSLLATAIDVGLSGPSRLHDLFLTLERMTPGEYKAGGRGLTIRWAMAETPLGPALMAAHDRGLCAVSFGERAADLQARWPGARLVRDVAAIRPYAESFRARLRGRVDRPLALLLGGTPLQLRTWEALLRIPPGRVLAYGDVARLAGAPGAARAVGSAIGHNPIAVLIPCHRVIRATGAVGDYRWGAERKAALLGLERAAE